MYCYVACSRRTEFPLAGNIAWRGRYCAFEYRLFEHFLQYILAQVTGRPVPSPDPWDPDLSSQMRKLKFCVLIMSRAVLKICNCVLYMPTVLPSPTSSPTQKPQIQGSNLSIG